MFRVEDAHDLQHLLCGDDLFGGKLFLGDIFV